MRTHIHRKNDYLRHHHSEGVVYRSFCLNSSTFAVSEIAARRWWCIESPFPTHAFADQTVCSQALRAKCTELGAAINKDYEGKFPLVAYYIYIYIYNYMLSSSRKRPGVFLIVSIGDAAAVL